MTASPPSSAPLAPYRGRFAPSPTGLLHFGSLFTAVASYLDARSQGGHWQLRFDDLDTPRAEPGAIDHIRASLEAHGLLWDGPVLFQSERRERYEAGLAQLARQDRIFYCRCSRRQRLPGRPYPGTCAEFRAPRDDAAIRYQPDAGSIRFEDRVQGRIDSAVAQTTGAFIIWRRDGIPGYALATAIDDGDASISQVVRGADLLDQTGPQLALMASLGLAAPGYAHVPVLTGLDGSKLSKQAGAKPLRDGDASANLAAVLRLLGIPAPAGESRSAPDLLLTEAADRWRIERLAGQQSLAAPS
jgi:glutamyl-Q tRNA(Asp) synthetase